MICNVLHYCIDYSPLNHIYSYVIANSGINFKLLPCPL